MPAIPEFLEVPITNFRNGQGRDRTVVHNLFYNNILCDSKNPCAAKSVALLDNPALSGDDRQALETIISLWPTLALEIKIGILQTIEAGAKVYAGR